MSPIFFPGDYVVTWRPPSQHYNVADYVIIDHPVHGIMLKQVVSTYNHMYTLQGVHPDSIESEKIGTLSAHEILGKVIFHIPKKEGK